MDVADLHETYDDRIAERCRPVVPGDDGSLERSLDGEFVLYWMRNAARAHENPALDAAVAAANRLDVPALVYHGVAESYPYASDRHHTFILEGARQVQRDLRERGIGYLLHVERRGHRGDHLTDLCDRAALVVAEEVPVEPLRTWRPALASATETPVVAVDADCIVPMRLVGRLYDRAYKYRNAVEDVREARVERAWSDVEPTFDRYLPDDLPVEPVDLGDAAIPELVARCDIDHAVGPIPGTTGGRQAGYQRWAAYRDEHLDDYNRRRNTPTDPEGVSRMSAYLHWGHVSPFRMARQAHARDSRGAEKYIDEMVTWRELAHHFCYYDPNHGTVEALPDWALESLREHESDERPALYDWETLARADTDDELWNLCQTSLLRHGELHNNVRMTWAKKLLEWTPNIERALALALDLNHRYALDGSDPNSYHGIQWCFGAFDRPYDADRAIIGKLRPRDTDWHAGRIDMEAYRAQVTAPPVEDPPSVAVVGAGVAGSICARTLCDHGLDVEVFDKARGPGGRVSTRRLEREGGGELQFDHGAPYFRVDGEPLRRHVDAWAEQGIVADWTGRCVAIENGERVECDGEDRRVVGLPKMNAVIRHLADDVSVAFDTRVGAVERDGATWRLLDPEGDALGTYDALVVTPPAPQTAALLEGVETPLRETVEAVDMAPTWTVMLAYAAPLDVEFDAARLEQEPLDRIVRDADKPGRDAAETWVLHSTGTWASDHLEESEPAVGDALEQAFETTIGETALGPERLARRVHRWRYARADGLDDRPALFDADIALAVAGDWVGGPGVAGAFASGCAAAGHLLRTIE